MNTSWKKCRFGLRKFWSLVRELNQPLNQTARPEFRITSDGGRIGRFNWTSHCGGGLEGYCYWGNIPF